jgi:hypothetical protein
MKNLLIVVLLLALFGLSWMQIRTQQKLDIAQQQQDSLAQHLDKTKIEINQLKNKISELDKTSINGLVKEANNAILGGWETLVNGVGEEVKRARELMQESIQEQTTPKPDPQQNPSEIESPKILERT